MSCSKCPFYGYRWPERTTDIYQVGGNECGLDFDANGPCKMESSGRSIDFRECEIVARAGAFLSVVANRIRFVEWDHGDTISFAARKDEIARNLARIKDTTRRPNLPNELDCR